jgi:copper(I)-binding protein
MFKALAAIIMIAGPVAAEEFALGELTVMQPTSFATIATARAGAGYLRITNNGATDDRLISVKSDFPRTMIHMTSMDDAGVATMSHMGDGLLIPAGETVALAPGGAHVMFMGLDRGLAEGDTFDATLVFENAGELAVIFNVEARPEVDHSGH